MLEKYTIRGFDEKVYTKKEFLDQLKRYNEKKYNVYIGTDSKIVKNKIAIVTAICFHKLGSSGKIFYIKEKVSRKEYPNLRIRMLLEAYRSIELAMDIEQYVDGKLEIHLDVGNTIKSKTSAYESELQSFVISQGYNCAIKPYSWASSAVADKVAKKS